MRGSWILLVLCLPTFAAPATKAADKPVKVKWMTSYESATQKARKDDKIILTYFSGSDWCPYTQKLDKEVLNTKLFRDWTRENVILLQIDFPARKRQSGSMTKRNEAIKGRFNIVETPTFVFIDGYGQEVARADYQAAHLREHEPKGRPFGWINFAKEAIKTRPKQETLVSQAGLIQTIEHAGKYGLPLLLLVSSVDTDAIAWKKKLLLEDPRFVGFANTNTVFTEVNWPGESDDSDEARTFREIAERLKIAQTAWQLVLVDRSAAKVLGRASTLSPAKLDTIITRFTRALPPVKYDGNWIEDYRVARAVAGQRNRELLISFTQLDASKWCQKLDAEIYQHEDFQNYARRHLVLLKVDFPKNGKQSESLREQNNMLADSYGVRGYPTIVILNAAGQKIGQSKYPPGGPGPFLAELHELRKKDQKRRNLPSQQVKKK